MLYISYVILGTINDIADMLPLESCVDHYNAVFMMLVSLLFLRNNHISAPLLPTKVYELFNGHLIEIRKPMNK